MMELLAMEVLVERMKSRWCSIHGWLAIICWRHLYLIICYCYIYYCVKPHVKYKNLHSNHTNFDLVLLVNLKHFVLGAVNIQQLINTALNFVYIAILERFNLQNHSSTVCRLSCYFLGTV